MTAAEVLEIARTLSRRTCGAVSAVMLRRAGADLTAIPRLIRAGHLTKLFTGMYIVGPVTPAARMHAAVLHAGTPRPLSLPQPPPVVTGLAAARAFQMRWLPEGDRVQVLVGPEVRRTSNDDVLVRRAHDLDAITTTTWGGVRLADPARVVVDGTRECQDLRAVRGLVLGAVADGWATPPDLRALLDNGAIGGSALSRRAVKDAERGCASPPEAEFIDALVEAAVPTYANCEIWYDGRLIAVVDGYLVGTGVAGEIDSRERHGSIDDLDATLTRHRGVEEVGLSLLHCTPTRFRQDPLAFIRLLLAQAARRRAAGLGDPPGIVLRPRGPLLGVAA